MPPKKELQKTDLPVMLTISKVIPEAKNHKTLFFNHKLDVKPGQFIKLWIPGVDSKPFADSFHKKGSFAVTFQIIGKFTKALSKVKAGDIVGLFGPYGNSFSAKKNAVVVGGGCGMASLSNLIDRLKNPVIINGARSKDYILFRNRYKSAIIATDDGSSGKKAFTTDILKELLQKRKYSIVYTCGPEIMMKKVLDICNKYKVNCEASLERYMSCGFGICGKCAINDKLVCQDGPVFNSKQLSKMTEFGNFHRLKSGRKVKF